MKGSIFSVTLAFLLFGGLALPTPAAAATQPDISDGAILVLFVDVLKTLSAIIADIPHESPIPQQVAAGGASNTVAAASNIGQLANTVISNPIITGGTITAASIAGTITNAINAAVATITNLTATNATTTNLVVTNASTTALTLGTGAGFLQANGAGQVSATSTLSVGSLVGVLPASTGGTGITNPLAAGILLSTYAGGGWQQLATSSLGLLTTNVAEGSNLYFTNARADARINATSSIGTLLSAPNLITVGTLSNLTATNATTTTLFATTASSTNLFASTASFGSLAGAAFSSLTTNYLPRWSNGTWTNSHLYDNGTNVGIGTTSPSALLTLDSLSATGTILRISNSSTGAHVFDLLSTGSGNTNGAGRLDIFDSTAGLARLSIAGLFSSTDFEGRLGIPGGENV